MTQLSWGFLRISLFGLPPAPKRRRRALPPRPPRVPATVQPDGQLTFPLLA